MVDRVIYKKSEPDFMPFCVVNFRKFDQLTVSASHDQLTVAASHDQLSK